MERIYILEPGCYLRRQGQSITVMHSARVVDQIPAGNLKRLVLVGWVSLSGGVLDFLIQNRVETVFMTPTGRFRARLALDEHRHVALRQAQYAKLGNAGVARDISRILVAGKLENMRRFLVRQANTMQNPVVKTAAARMAPLLRMLDDMKDPDRIRGVEGAGSATYFSVFGDMIRNEGFHFHGRNRRPPLDPVNALLSFVYTMLTNEVLSAINAAGLDPYLGALHEVAYGRPSLACDLVEEYRCFLGDRLVLSLINRKSVGPDDFVYRGKQQCDYADEEEMKEKRPVEMKPAVRRTFIQAYEKMMKRSITVPDAEKKLSYRWLIHHQVRKFSRWLIEGELYHPFVW